jgi:hypothetical protein
MGKDKGFYVVRMDVRRSDPDWDDEDIYKTVYLTQLKNKEKAERIVKKLEERYNEKKLIERYVDSYLVEVNGWENQYCFDFSTEYMCIPKMTIKEIDELLK